ncbi:hypothetical protein BU24DRAFT_496704 [Aaosphaeria arxii CBS 175.79]|uniref:ATP synthase F(0) complex subunit e, mitochondrial n=1 Tax=Aaosphaeria arxii CBS 175.79 TaxID=1450172 RepID=A0A6A5XA95_9PLEO|nr:uncharacterized protein BU24DRAFT_496704 [Aaosphaeria arxii CBS 175.79]KAF2009871.1 hypothetical protein BU24DRAFT_496704 [Aaosphaeria arxii CBS 175.79]
MSTSVGVNVLRWSALGLGVFYGIYHQTSISARDRASKAEAEWKHKESLISQAKAEFAKSQNAGAASSSSDKSADPTKDPNADLNTLLGITDKN